MAGVVSFSYFFVEKFFLSLEFPDDDSVPRDWCAYSGCLGVFGDEWGVSYEKKISNSSLVSSESKQKGLCRILSAQPFGIDGGWYRRFYERLSAFFLRYATNRFSSSRRANRPNPHQAMVSVMAMEAGLNDITT